MRILYFALLTTILWSCSSSKLYYNKAERNWSDKQMDTTNELAYTLYLLGDVGDDTSLSAPVLGSLKTKLNTSVADQTGVVFLGDNIYQKGLHKKGHKLRKEDELRIDAQINAVKDFNGEIVFIPGNHDWQSGGVNGDKFIKRQEKYIQKKLDRGNVFRPSHGCAGPDVVELGPGLIMIIIDTQWWLHHHNRPNGEKDGCDVRTTDELVDQFKHVLKKYRDQNVIVAAHHPLYSNGEHGGHFKPKDHLFPITAKKKNLYIPLPGVGSIYPYYRKIIGVRQDITHPIYQEMKRQLTKVINEYDNVVYAAGHEHNLQYTHRDAIHHIISGSGSKVTNMAYNRNLGFGAKQRGYARLKYYSNGECWLEFFTFDENRVEQLAYRKLLFVRKPLINREVDVKNKPSYAGKYATVIPDSIKAAGALKKVVFGELNRELWTTPIKVPYLDIHYEKGGLKPIKKGGGMQTLSLRMEGGDGNQYTLRGVKKSPTYFVEKQLRGTISQDIAYDGIAASHPYATIVVPTLSRAAKVYHAVPKLVYVPKDSILGDYLEEFGGMFCLFEERPNEDVSEADNFGNSKHVMSTPDAIDEMHSKYKHKVDKDYAVRSRLFDMLIGDFDRHDDQWRWASFSKKDKVLYRPIPRDRDQAFFKPDGIVMSMAKWRWLLWYVQPYKEDISDMAGTNRQGRHFDRSFLTEASWKDWRKEARYIQEHVTDEVIEKAIKEFPKEAYDINGEDIIRKLKSRRDKMVEIAERYYKILALKVDVVGTFKQDYFDVVRLANGDVEVNVYARDNGKRDKDKRYYHRVFHYDETNEIVLYGLEGEDEYRITGSGDKSILIRIVAGPDRDLLNDKSRVNGRSKMTQYYDDRGKNEINTDGETRVELKKDKNAFDYDRKQFEYNILAPGLSMGYNANDGFILGPAFSYKVYGFKKEPYSQFHKGYVNRTFQAQGFNAKYEVDLVDVVKRWNFVGKVEANLPLVYQYFGRNNQQTNIEGDRVRMTYVVVTPALRLHSKSLSQTFDVFGQFQHVDFEETTYDFAPQSDMALENIVGGGVAYKLSDLDNQLNPHHGIEISGSAAYQKGMNSNDMNFMQFKTEVSLYFPIVFMPRQTTLAYRGGYAGSFGNFTFFQANFLNGFENYRGVARNRFSGNAIQYNNLDLRISLHKVRNKVVPFDVGLIAHVDGASSWQSRNQRIWYTSYGGGGFIKVMDYMMLVGTYSVSDYSNVFVLGTKFLF